MEENLFENIMMALDDYGQAVADLYKKRLLADDKKATGKLIDSVETVIAYKGTEFVVYLKLEDYWKYVEKGRRKGKKMPPVDAILEWIKVRHILPRPKTLKRGGTSKTPFEKQQRSLAFAISKSIAKNGIPAGNQLKDTIESINAQYLPILQEALNKDWTKYSIKIFKNVNRLVSKI